jgi:glutamine amidotransferase
MGWNRLVDPTGNLFEAKLIEDYYYFVHSFYVEAGPDTSSIGEYIKPFSASLEKENFYATQFHPEKSGSAGEALLKRFLAI